MQSSLIPSRTFCLGVEKPTRSTRPDDPGNWTGGRCHVGILIGSQCGVSAVVLSSWLGRTATRADMEAVTPDTMHAIFGSNYWLRVNGDRLPLGIDLQTADHGYNRGAATSAMLTQRVVGARDDGWIGEATLAALAAWTPAKVNLSLLDARTLQQAIGVTVDGKPGPGTLARLGRLPVPMALSAVLYAAQVHDYRSLEAFPRNPGWLVRAERRWEGACALIHGERWPQEVSA